VKQHQLKWTLVEDELMKSPLPSCLS